MKTATALLIVLALCGTFTYLYLNNVLEEDELDIDLYDDEESIYY